jgi:hypothetical protein
MIRSLLYLTATRPDIQFSVCLCTRFQASPRTLPTSAFGTPRPLLWCFMVLRMRILPGVGCNIQGTLALMKLRRFVDQLLIAFAYPSGLLLYTTCSTCLN